jgi:hypothetical protein
MPYSGANFGPNSKNRQIHQPNLLIDLFEDNMLEEVDNTSNELNFE